MHFVAHKKSIKRNWMLHYLQSILLIPECNDIDFKNSVRVLIERGVTSYKYSA